jgi:hypothetical protein
MFCGEAGSATAVLQVPDTRVSCITVTISESFSVECPIRKTDIPAGTATLEFSMFPLTSGREHIQNGLPGPVPFVVLGNPTAMVADVQFLFRTRLRPLTTSSILPFDQLCDPLIW